MQRVPTSVRPNILLRTLISNTLKLQGNFLFITLFIFFAGFASFMLLFEQHHISVGKGLGIELATLNLPQLTQDGSTLHWTKTVYCEGILHGWNSTVSSQMSY
jgi:hypothetical protein